MIKEFLRKSRQNIVLMLVILTMAILFASCNGAEPTQSITDTPSNQPSQSPIQTSEEPIEEEPDYMEFDMIMQYQNGIQSMPLIYDYNNLTLTATDGYTVSIPVVDFENRLYPIYQSRSNDTLNTSLIAIPNSSDSLYILWNQHKIYYVNLSKQIMDTLLLEEDDDTTYDKSLEENEANGLYWGTKPKISENGKYLIYLTNRRNNGKTNDIRLYDFETKEDILLVEDSFYNDAYISETTIFYTCNDMLWRVDIASKIKSPVSYSISSNGNFSYPYYIYTKTYYQEYEILNLLTLNVEKGKLGSQSSALKISAMRTDTLNIASVVLLDNKNVTVTFLDLQSNEILKTFVVSESFLVVYAHWKNSKTFILSGYEGGSNEKTYMLSY